MPKGTRIGRAAVGWGESDFAREARQRRTQRIAKDIPAPYREVAANLRAVAQAILSAQAASNATQRESARERAWREKLDRFSAFDLAPAAPSDSITPDTVGAAVMEVATKFVGGKGDFVLEAGKHGFFRVSVEPTEVPPGREDEIAVPLPAFASSAFRKQMERMVESVLGPKARKLRGPKKGKPRRKSGRSRVARAANRTDTIVKVMRRRKKK